MAKVSNLKIRLQTGSDNTLLATWDFDTQQKISSGGSLKVGSWVNIKSGAKYYNGVSVPSWVINSGPWKIYELRGDRAVINENQSGSNRIMSPINVNYLSGTGGESSVTEDTLDHYTYTWFYDTGDGVWLQGEHGDTEDAETTNRYATWSAPEYYTRIHIHVIPVSKTYKVNDKDTSYWTGDVVIAEWLPTYEPPEVPPTPDIEVDGYTLTATINNITDSKTDEVTFEIYDLTTQFAAVTGVVQAAMVSVQQTINPGGSYRVRARAIRLSASSFGTMVSDWTEFTEPVNSIPAAPTEITKLRGASSTSIYAEWSVVNSAETYELEYTTNVDYFDASSETTSVTGIELTHYTVTGLTSGDEYFFRVRAVNDQGESAWTEIKSVTIGKAPSAPTTWSSTTTAITGESLNLYWVHNAQDASREQYAQIEITVGSGSPHTTTIKNPDADNEEEEETTRSYAIDTSQYVEGTKIQWRVRTSGITQEFGPWSVMRTVDIYAQPTLALQLTNQNGTAITNLTSFPLFIKGLAGPNTQEPIGYSVSISPVEGYQTVDYLGQTQIIQAGDIIYNSYVDTNDALLLELTAADVNFDSGMTYTVTVVVSMNSGLTATASTSFAVSWEDDTVPLDMQIAIDDQSYTAYITPYCRDTDGNLIPGYQLAVYRREFDGTFTQIAAGLDSAANTAVTDPHPALDYARYRIVAMANTTGAITYYDPPGYPVNCTSIIIQWDEAWTNFDTTNTGVRAEPPWSGSLLELPYNIDVSDNINPDVEYVDYIGRSYPVSYYGTAIESSSSWSTEIPATDVETIYALRRLQVYKGDCYVREPSGTGYWASIQVSFSITHLELTIPVTIDITRVSGGI